MWSVVNASRSDINESAMVAPNTPESPIKLMTIGTMGASEMMKSSRLQKEVQKDYISRIVLDQALRQLKARWTPCRTCPQFNEPFKELAQEGV